MEDIEKIENKFGLIVGQIYFRMMTAYCLMLYQCIQYPQIHYPVDNDLELFS